MKIILWVISFSSIIFSQVYYFDLTDTLIGKEKDSILSVCQNGDKHSKEIMELSSYYADNTWEVTNDTNKITDIYIQTFHVNVEDTKDLPLTYWVAAECSFNNTVKKVDEATKDKIRTVRSKSRNMYVEYIFYLKDRTIRIIYERKEGFIFTLQFIVDYDFDKF